MAALHKMVTLTSRNHCSKSCNEYSYKTEFTTYESTGDYPEYNMEPGYLNMFIFFENLVVEIKTEEYVYGFGTAIAAVGGSMGLFLGTSCYSLVSGFLDGLQYIFSAIKRRLQIKIYGDSNDN